MRVTAAFHPVWCAKDRLLCVCCVNRVFLSGVLAGKEEHIEVVGHVQVCWSTSGGVLSLV